MVVLIASLLLTLSATIVAAPTNDLPSRNNACKLYLDTFEEYGTALAGQATPVGQYHGVTYRAFGVTTKSATLGTIAGVTPHSGNNGALASMAVDLVQIGAAMLNPFGSILATPSQSFELYSFWFGCGQNTANAQAPSTPVGCAISVTGYTKDNLVVPVASFNYAPTSSTASPTVLATLPSTFWGLKNVTLGITAGSLVTAQTILVLDDVTHCNN